MIERLLIWLGFGRSCPDCKVRPGKEHQAACPTGDWDGGVWA